MTATGRMPEFDAVILAGGKSARMDGVDKPGLSVGGTAMLVWVARAAAGAGPGARRLIVVGPERTGTVRAGLAAVAEGLPGGLICVSEHPPAGGPVPALRRGLAEVTAQWLVLLAADLPFLTGQHIAALLAAGVKAGTAGVVLADDKDRPQWLASAWQARALRTAMHTYAGDSLHSLMAPLDFVLLRPASAGDGRAPWLDCDTPDDLAAARRAVAGRDL